MPLRPSWLAALALCLSSWAQGAGTSAYNDFGGSGLMQNPDARMADDGEFALGVGVDRPYNQLHFRLQLLPWLESMLRYTDVVDVPYGPSSFSGSQSYKDRSADFKIRLLEESGSHPAVALGLRDVGGTGLFSSEYLVASRRYYDFDVSAGIAWGRIGANGNWPNPLGFLSGHFNNPRVVGSATSDPGNVGFKRLFIGPTVGPFGGVIWNTPLRGLRLMAEYDGNDYQHEAFNALPRDLPVNFGVGYEALPGLDVMLAYERGNQLSLNLNLHANFQQDRGIPKFADPPPEPIRVRVQHDDGALPAVTDADRAQCESSAVMDTIRSGFARQGFTLYAASCSAERRGMSVWMLQNTYRDRARGIGRAARVMSEAAPDWVEQFTIIEMAGGVEVQRTQLLRADLERYAQASGSAEEIATHAEFPAVQATRAIDAAPVQNDVFPRTHWDVSPALRQSIGGPDNFYFYQIWAKLAGVVEATSRLSFNSVVGINVYNTFDGIRLQSNSVLPHVRSDVAEYLKQGPNALVRLEGNYIWSPWSQVYARVSAGIFEEMYAGVAGEVLYRPSNSPLAVGLDVNRVRQRGFTERFDFRDYEVTTGHLNLYAELPYYGVLSHLSYGRYLAGDWGMTFDLSRNFANGVTAGIFATFTNVPATQFGEGQFDKGVYLSIPLDLFFPKSSRRSAGFLFRPLTRDGGQKVRDGYDLYGVVSSGSVGATMQSWPAVMR